MTCREQALKNIGRCVEPKHPPHILNKDLPRCVLFSCEHCCTANHHVYPRHGGFSNDVVGDTGYSRPEPIVTEEELPILQELVEVEEAEWPNDVKWNMGSRQLVNEILTSMKEKT